MLRIIKDSTLQLQRGFTVNNEMERLRADLESKFDETTLQWASLYIATMNGLANVCPTQDLYMNFSSTIHDCIKTKMQSLGMELDAKFIDCSNAILRGNTTALELFMADRADEITNLLFGTNQR